MAGRHATHGARHIPHFACCLPIASRRRVPACQAARRPGCLARGLAIGEPPVDAFSFGSVMAGIGAVALASCVVLPFTWSSFLSFFRERWRTVAICEVVFIVAFLAFVMLRMANPDLWHQWQGARSRWTRPTSTPCSSPRSCRRTTPGTRELPQLLLLGTVHRRVVHPRDRHRHGGRGEPCRADVLRPDRRRRVQRRLQPRRGGAREAFPQTTPRRASLKER